MSDWNEERIWSLLKCLSTTTAKYVGNRLCSGINFQQCSAKEITKWLRQYSRTKKLPTEEEVTEAILMEVFGALRLPEDTLKKIESKGKPRGK